MTKTIIIGQPEEAKKELKKIEFVSHITAYGLIECDHELQDKPIDWKYIELISKDYGSGFDIMFVYDNPDIRSKGCLYLGHWNDGVV